MAYRKAAQVKYVILSMLCIVVLCACADTQQHSSSNQPEALLTTTQHALPYLQFQRPLMPESVTVCLDGIPDAATVSLQVAVDTWNAMPLTFLDEPIPSESMDFTSALLHELGHQLGIRQHIQGQDNVMFPLIVGYGGTKRIVTAEDMALLPEDAPPLALVDDIAACDVHVRWGDTSYTTSTGHRVTAACLSYGGRIVCNAEESWYYIPEENIHFD